MESKLTCFAFRMVLSSARIEVGEVSENAHERYAYFRAPDRQL
jgi:hypothetical protein